MKIATFGARTQLSQIDRLENELFLIRKHISDHDSPDLIYCNDIASIDDAVALKKKTGAFTMVNILDLPYFLPNFMEIIQELRTKLPFADKVTCISKTVQKDVKEYLQIDSEVIYNPIKPVIQLGFKRHIPFLYSGRANDAMKRFWLMKQTLVAADISQSDLVVVGPENPNFGRYLGIVSDTQLNCLYNSSKFLIYPSGFDGLGLPPIEFLISGGVPIVCSDSRVSLEFFPEEVICEPTVESIVKKLNHINNNYNQISQKIHPFREKLYLLLSPSSICDNILKIYHERRT